MRKSKFEKKEDEEKKEKGEEHHKAEPEKDDGMSEMQKAEAGVKSGPPKR